MPESRFVCKVCGYDQSGYLNDFDYEYCQKCLTAYDTEGNIIPERDIPEPDYDPDDPDKERDL